MITLIKQDYLVLMKRNNFSFVKFFFKLMSTQGFQVVFLYRLSNFFRNNKLKFLSIILGKFQYYFYHCEIRSTAIIGGGFVIRHPIGIVIGGKVKIGNNFSIGKNTTLGGNNGKFREKNISQPYIGNNVIVGAHSIIIGPIVIGNNVKIGAMTLVNKDIEDSETCVGVPGRIVK